MMKWEYTTLGLLNAYGLQYKLNGEKQNHWKEHPLHEVLHDLGEQGWELVSFDGESYIFKRPVSGTGSIQPLGAHAAGEHHAPAAGHPAPQGAGEQHSPAAGHAPQQHGTGDHHTPPTGHAEPPTAPANHHT
jgi:hypothetical protein